VTAAHTEADLLQLSAALADLKLAASSC
jgi:hypothetical protein